jgi:hypothetical protein
MFRSDEPPIHRAPKPVARKHPAPTAADLCLFFVISAGIGTLVGAIAKWSDAAYRYGPDFPGIVCVMVTGLVLSFFLILDYHAQTSAR